MLPFINREDELKRLRTMYQSDRPELVIVYGRRRMGKTRLIIESIKGFEDIVYHQAIQGTTEQQMESFIQDVSETFPGVDQIRKDWENILRFLVKKDAIVIIDEFPYLVKESKELPSLIQRIWDHEVHTSSTTFVLIGSSIGMIHDIAIDGGAPLYGRVSKRPNGRLNIGPLSFSHAMKFFPNYDPIEQVMAYGVYGGTPEYLRAIDTSISLRENIQENLLRSDGALHEEPENVLHRELKEVDRYFSILKAMAEGCTTVNEIGQAAGVITGSEGFYLDRLMDLRIVRRSYPVTVDPARSRKGRYHIQDPLFRFWFRFIFGRSSRYEVYGEGAYEDLIEPHLPDFVSPCFEELCQRALLQAYKGEHKFLEMPGNWWDNRGNEIDIVAPTSGKTMLIGEVKFQNKPMDYGVLARLEDKVSLLDWSPRVGKPNYGYVLFSRSGFSASLRDAAEERDDLRLFDMRDVVFFLSGGSGLN